ncbi:hypothetical protein LEMLEM_LOCUS2031 [Lemmus lemmus]
MISHHWRSFILWSMGANTEILNRTMIIRSLDLRIASPEWMSPSIPSPQG